MLQKLFELEIIHKDSLKYVRGFKEGLIKKCYDDWCQIHKLDNNDERLKGLLSNNITIEEAFPVLFFTSDGSDWINKLLRNNDILNELEDLYKHLLLNSLNKIHSFSDKKVYRMDSPHGDYNEILKWFKAKKQEGINIPYFLSTSKENWNSSPIIWEITTMNQSLGKDISNLSQVSSEKEVLFTCNSSFQVIDVRDNVVYMEETNYNKAGILLCNSYWGKN